jgi:LEA14-like dessication related protein
MIKKLSIFLAVAVIAVSCRPIKDPVFNGIDSVKVNNVGLGESSVTLGMSYSNPNNYKAKLKSAEGDAWMDSTYLGHFVVDSTVDIPANANFLVPVNLTVDMKKILRNSFAGLLNRQVLIRITGTGRAGRNGIYRNFKLNYQGKQDLSKIFAGM